MKLIPTLPHHLIAPIILFAALLIPLSAPAGDDRGSSGTHTQTTRKSWFGRTDGTAQSTPQRQPEVPLISHQLYKESLRRNGDALDELQQKLEEYGSITMSSVILARPSPVFAFELHLPAQTLYNDAQTKIEGSASAQFTASQTFSFGANVQADLDQLAAAKVGLARFNDANKAFQKQQTINNDVNATEAKLADKEEQVEEQDANRMSEAATKDAQFRQERINETYAIAEQDERDALKKSKETEAQGLKDNEAALTDDLAKIDAANPPPADITAAKNAAKLHRKTQDDAAKAARKTTDKEAASTLTDALEKKHTDEKANEQTKNERLVAAERKIVEAKRTRDTKVKALFPVGTAPDRPVSTPASNVPGAAAADLAPTLATLITEMEKLRTDAKILPANSALTVPDRAAIEQAAGDSATLSLLNFLGNPSQAAEFSDKKVLFGVVTVGVNPGWRTKKDFAGTVTTQSSYVYQDARPEVLLRVASSPSIPMSVRSIANRQLAGPMQVQGVPEDAGLPPAHWRFGSGEPSSPLVAGVSPLSDSQTLDLKDDYRRQDAFGVQLALSLRKQGAEGQAKAFEQYVQQRRKDTQTRSSGGVINSFSSQGGLFGFQVGPRLKALEDPASKKGGAANILDRQSFPALLFFGIDPADLEVRVKIIDHEEHCDANGVRLKKPITPRFIIVEPRIQFVATNRWMPLKTPGFAWASFYNPINWHKARFSERDRVEMMIQSADARNGITGLEKSCEFGGDSSYTGVISAVDHRYTALKALVQGAHADFVIPEELMFPPATKAKTPLLPQIRSVVPDTIVVPAGADGKPQVGFTSSVVISGSDLSCVDSMELAMGNGAAKVEHVTAMGDGSLLVDLSFADWHGPLLFKAVLNPKLSGLGAPGHAFSILTPPVMLVKGTFSTTETTQAAEVKAVAETVATPVEKAALLFPDKEPDEKLLPHPVKVDRTAARSTPISIREEESVEPISLAGPLPKR